MQSDTKLKKVIQTLSNQLNTEKKKNQEFQHKLVEEQNERQQLELQKNEIEIQMKYQTNHNQQIQFTNTKLTKQVEYLQQCVNHKKTIQKGGLINSLWSGGSQIEELQKQISILQEELQIKIEENENIHINIFESKKQNDQEIQKIVVEKTKAEDQLAMIQIKINQKNDEVKSLNQKFECINQEKEDLQDQLKQVKVQFKLIQTRLEERLNDQQNKLKNAKQTISENVVYLDNQKYEFYKYEYKEKELEKVDIDRYEISSLVKQFQQNWDAKNQVIQMNQNKEEGEEYSIVAKNFKNMSSCMNKNIESLGQLFSDLEKKKDYEQFVDNLEQLTGLFRELVKEYEVYLEDQEYYLVKTEYLIREMEDQGQIVNDILERLEQVCANLKSVREMMRCQINPYSRLETINQVVGSNIENIEDQLIRFCENQVSKVELENRQLQMEDQEDVEMDCQKVIYKQTIKMKITVKNYNNNIGSFFRQMIKVVEELKDKKIVRKWLTNWINQIIKEECCQKYKHVQFLDMITKQHREQKEGLKYQEVVQLQKEYQQLKSKYEFQQNQLDSYKEALKVSEQQLSMQIDREEKQVDDYEEDSQKIESVFDPSINVDPDYKMEIRIIDDFDYSQFDQQQYKKNFTKQKNQLVQIMMKNQLLESQKQILNQKIDSLKGTEESHIEKVKTLQKEKHDIENKLDKKIEEQKSIQENYEQQIIMLSENLASLQS